MEELSRYFPIEIVFQIIQYTYRYQDKQLLNDIINFTESKKILLDLYLLFYTINNEPQEYINWLSNDITYYMNTFYHTGVLYGGRYVDTFYIRFSRNPFLNSNEKIDKYVINLNKNGNLIKKINIYLGLLTISERNDFVSRTVFAHEMILKLT